MAIKILVNALGQHTLADVKQVENSETNEVIAYWVKEPRTVVYRQNEDGTTNINFALPCPIAVEQEYSVRADSVVSILTPSEQVERAYNNLVYPETAESTVVTELNDVTESADTEERVESGSADD